MSEVAKPDGDIAKLNERNGNLNGQINSNGTVRSDEEDYASLSCSSLHTEEVAALQKRRQARTPSEGYPGLAFGGAGFSSNTMIRLRVIANELHNISSVQLKRAEGEMNALGKRIESVEGELKNEEKALQEANKEITDISKELTPEQQTEKAEQPGDTRLHEIEVLRSRLQLLKTMYDLSN